MFGEILTQDIIEILGRKGEVLPLFFCSIPNPSKPHKHWLFRVFTHKLVTLEIIKV